MRVDGLASGDLPPTSTIQQIRIRQNAFDAEFHEATPPLSKSSRAETDAVASERVDVRPVQAAAGRNASQPDAPARASG